MSPELVEWVVSWQLTFPCFDGPCLRGPSPAEDYLGTPLDLADFLIAGASTNRDGEPSVQHHP
jgi:hypothetical protein